MFPQLLGSQNDMATIRLMGAGQLAQLSPSISRRPSGLRKTTCFPNSLAHRTRWLRAALFMGGVDEQFPVGEDEQDKSEAKRS